jgi:RNA polymerase sigma-70 factor, ECF subfamily
LTARVPATPHPITAAAPETGKTLGGLLYADATRERIPESVWSDLVRAVAQGDPLALRTLYDRAHRLVFTLALRITGSRETAEELTVDVFHGIWLRASTYDPDVGTVIAWIMNQARSRSIDRQRHDNRRKRVNHDGCDLAGEATAGDASHDLDRETSSRRLHQALAGLSPDERSAISTAYFADLSHAEVAARLDQPLGTIKTRIRSGLAKLRRTLKGVLGP